MSSSPPAGRIACPHCGGMMKSAGLAAGAAVKCPKCGKGFRVGEAAEVEGRKSKVEGRESGGRGQVTGDRGQGTRGSRQAGLPDSGVPSTQYSVPSTNATQPGTSRASTASAAAAGGAANPESRIQNPKSPRRDELVDPNLLAPPPPRVKPKPQEVPVVCHVCGTRVYAKLDKIGQEVKCPDCFTRLVVPPLKDESGGKGQESGKPTLQGAEDYGMSEVVERPKYRPLQAARGEYEVLSAFDPATMEHRLTVPGQRPKKKGRVTVEPVEEEENEAAVGQGDDIALGPEVERVQYVPDPRSMLPQPEIEEADALYDGRYDDGLIGDGVDPRSPDAWKKAPLLYGIVGFLFYPSTLLRWAVFAVMLAGVGTLMQTQMRLATSEAGQDKVLAVFMIKIAVPAAAVWLISFCAAGLAIVQGTGNGENEITSWPDWNPFDWFSNALYMLIAGLAAGLPGGVISAATLGANVEDPAMAAFGLAAPLLLSLMVLFPFVLYSMLTEDSVMAVFSPQVLHTFRVAADAWVIFYMYSILICLFGGIGLGLLFAESMAVRALAASGVMGLALLYLRLVGRLIWCANERLAKSGYQGS